MIIRKSQLLIRTIIVRKQGPRGTRQKNFKNGTRWIKAPQNEN